MYTNVTLLIKLINQAGIHNVQFFQVITVRRGHHVTFPFIHTYIHNPRKSHVLAHYSNVIRKLVKFLFIADTFTQKLDDRSQSSVPSSNGIARKATEKCKKKFAVEKNLSFYLFAFK